MSRLTRRLVLALAALLSPTPAVALPDGDGRELVEAVCTSCHTSHDILPHTDPRSSVSPQKVVDTCLTCHANIEDVHRKVIDRIRGGSALFAYYPDRDWFRRSRFLRCDLTRLAKR